ncbi:MULE domain-containing protein [Trichostrongylus colubriformis]|uniref:MULE domain-containing protein n=1 Tax=Trichostrongylus colubriformis TaxID=6319 RepID=A0AAN8EV17_TRICO
MRKGKAYAQPLLAPEGRPSKASRGSRANSRTNPQGKRSSSGHVGHELDPALLRFSGSQRLHLKSLLEEHSMDYIIGRLRKDDPTRSSKLSFVVQDLHNIVTRYNMAPGWRHNDDLTSIQIRFEENNLDDGIRCLQLPEDPSGKGLLLVIITPLMLEWLKKYSTKSVSLDDTFHTTRYNLRLATLMVSDNRDRGLLGAFLISGTMTTVDVQRLFLEIKALIPDFVPATMVTDEAPCFYNGFRAVFPESRTQLHLCRFHIRQTWERKTKELVEASLRAMVNKALQHLLEEVQLDKFQRRFAEILAYFRTTQQNAMAEYLEKNYLSIQGATLDTTMISERFHLRIKEEFLHRNANSRLDGFVDLLIKAVEDLSESMEVKDRRRLADSAYRLKETHKRHRTAAKLHAADSDMVTDAGENKWHVQNKTSSKSFEVTFNGACTCHPKENTHCLFCGVCAYAWSCTCLDNRSGISCPHRHVVKVFSAGRLPAESILEEPVPPPTAPEFGAQTSEAQRRREERYHKLSAIKSTYAVVEATATSLAKVDTEEAMQQLEEILAHLQLAAGVAEPPSSLAVRPELAQSGGKPQLSKIPLYQRGKMKKPKKPTPGLHQEVRRLLESPSDKGDEDRDDSVSGQLY